MRLSALLRGGVRLYWRQWCLWLRERSSAEVRGIRGMLPRDERRSSPDSG